MQRIKIHQSGPNMGKIEELLAGVQKTLGMIPNKVCTMVNYYVYL
jgi:hypothetical protein